jgi:site-specific recombinase
MPTENGLIERRVQVDVTTLRGEPLGADTTVYTVALKGLVNDRWVEGYRLTSEQSTVSRRFELDQARSTVRFACRTADGTELVFEMLERLEALVARVNQLAEIWCSQVPRVRHSPAPLRAR